MTKAMPWPTEQEALEQQRLAAVRFEAECEVLRMENSRLRAALEWYAAQAIDDDNRAYRALHPDWKESGV